MSAIPPILPIDSHTSHSEEAAWNRRLEQSREDRRRSWQAHRALEIELGRKIVNYFETPCPEDEDELASDLYRERQYSIQEQADFAVREEQY